MLILRWSNRQCSRSSFNGITKVDGFILIIGHHQLSFHQMFIAKQIYTPAHLVWSVNELNFQPLLLKTNQTSTFFSSLKNRIYLQHFMHIDAFPESIDYDEIVHEWWSFHHHKKRNRNSVTECNDVRQIKHYRYIFLRQCRVLSNFIQFKLHFKLHSDFVQCIEKSPILPRKKEQFFAY